jgi:hypothetical protein
MTSENLGSFLNLSALLLGYAPFSLQRVCGWYVGNPFGLHAGQDVSAEAGDLPISSPAFSGVTGHVRVLTVSQASDLLLRTGLMDVQVHSIGNMPLPMVIGKPLEAIFPRRGHFLLMRARKP